MKFDDDEDLTEKQQNRIDLMNKLILPIILVTTLLTLLLRYLGKEDELEVHAKFTTGRLIQFSGDYRGNGGSIKFEYTVNGHAYTNERGHPNIISSKGYYLEKHYFPVVYDSLNPGNSDMLIGPKSFKFFHQPFPDSLSFVKEYIDE